MQDIRHTVAIRRDYAHVMALLRRNARTSRAVTAGTAAAASAGQAAGSEETMARARQGGAVAASAGALAVAALWIRHRRTSSRRVGPVRFRIAPGQRRAVKVRRGKGR